MRPLTDRELREVADKAADALFELWGGGDEAIKRRVLVGMGFTFSRRDGVWHRMDGRKIHPEHPLGVVLAILAEEASLELRERAEGQPGPREQKERRKRQSLNREAERVREALHRSGRCGSQRVFLSGLYTQITVQKRRLSALQRRTLEGIEREQEKLEARPCSR